MTVWKNLKLLSVLKKKEQQKKQGIEGGAAADKITDQYAKNIKQQQELNKRLEDAVFKGIELIAASGAELLLYSVNAVTQGTESQGEVTVRLARAGRIVNGVGADTDIVVASAKAYLSALNKLQDKTERINPQLTA